MFGPGVELLSGKVLAICDCGMPEAADEARELFAGTSLTLTDVPLEDHDRYMAIVLGLSHALSITFFHALTLSGRSSRELHGFASTTFAKQVATATEVARESADLYYEIQHLNPNTPEAFELLIRAATGVRHAAGDADRAAFLDIMKGGRAFLEG
jgi:chorismate mutase/prephenate dehydrogenase